MSGISIYVHVPFCAARCPYCDFATAPATSRLRARYLAALVDEIAREGVRLGRPRVRTLYVGGGTPSLLEPEEIASLGAALRLAFELRPDPEESVANWPGGGWEVLRSWRSRAAAAQPDDATIARLYRIAERELARAGYRHYEIANWSHPKKNSLHNLVYWRDGEWLGVGAGAHSHLGSIRSANPASLATYLARIAACEPRDVDREADPAGEAAMLALRLDRGLDLRRYGSRFGTVAAERVRSALAEVAPAGLVAVRGDRARLTARGRLLANEVFVRVLA